MSQVLEDFEHLLDLFLPLALRDCLAHAVAHVRIGDRVGNLGEGCLYCGKLFEDVDTVALFLDHSLHRRKVPDRGAQPLEDYLFYTRFFS